MDTSVYTQGNFLGGDQLTESEKEGLELTIEAVTLEEMRDGAEKVCVHWKESGRKPLLCNKTNSKRFQKLFGVESDDWVGRKVTLWFDPDVEFMGDIVGGIRVRMSGKKK